MKSVKIKALFNKYIKRECSKEELRQIIAYFKNSKDFSDVPTVEEVSELLENYPDLEEGVANRIYNNIIEIHKKEQPLVRKTSAIWKYAVAAVLTGILATGYFFRDNLYNTPQDITPIIVESNIEVGSDKATLTLEDGSVVTLGGESTYQAQNVKSNGEQIVYDAGKENSPKVECNYLTIPRGGQFFIKLSDGTKVWLNSESQIKYPVAFIDETVREVELVYGEAYFDVSPSTNHNGAKFKVLNQNQEVEVLGTEFNIKAYKEENNIYTTLVEGKVTVSHLDSKQNLVPNQQSTINISTKDITVQKVDVYSETSWRKGLFSFKSKTLKEIMIVLSRWYDIEVEFENSELENVKFNGVLSKQDTIEDILTSIINTNFITAYEIKDKKITIK